MHDAVHEDIEKAEKPLKNTVAVRLPEVPKKAHDKIKKYRAELIKQKGRVVTITEAYYEFIKTAKV